MSSLDRAIQAIDQGLAACPASHSEGYAPHGTESELCWRCVAVPADPEGVSGLCPACRTVMADEDYSTDAHADAATTARYPDMGLWASMTVQIPVGSYRMEFRPPSVTFVETDTGVEISHNGPCSFILADGVRITGSAPLGSFTFLFDDPAAARVNEPIPDEQYADLDDEERRAVILTGPRDLAGDAAPVASRFAGIDAVIGFSLAHDASRDHTPAHLLRRNRL